MGGGGGGDVSARDGNRISRTWFKFIIRRVRGWKRDFEGFHGSIRLIEPGYFSRQETRGEIIRRRENFWPEAEEERKKGRTLLNAPFFQRSSILSLREREREKLESIITIALRARGGIERPSVPGLDNFLDCCAN